MRYVLAAVSMSLVLRAAMAGGSAGGPVVIVRGDGVAVRFDAELAATPAARSHGLMHRTGLAPRHGMWFDFAHSGPVAMWMKDTLLPLDMVFVADDGRIVSIQRQTTPGALDLITPPAPVRYVLEINAGETARFALEVGDRVVLAPPCAAPAGAQSREADKAAKLSAKPSSDKGTRIGCREPS